MPPPSSDGAREVSRLEEELKKLEAEYNMFFAGRLPRPPAEHRQRVEGLMRKCDRIQMRNYAERFRFTTIQSRFMALVDLWDRGLRVREEGRLGPFVVTKARTTDAEPAQPGVVHVASFHDPARELDKLRALYDSMAAARRRTGETTVPFDRFVEVVTQQVAKLQSSTDRDVAFRVSVRDGKVSLTARVSTRSTEEGTADRGKGTGK